LSRILHPIGNHCFGNHVEVGRGTKLLKSKLKAKSWDAWILFVLKKTIIDEEVSGVGREEEEKNDEGKEEELEGMEKEQGARKLTGGRKRER